MKKRHGGPGNFPVSCCAGLGAVWVEPIEGEAAMDDFVHLVARVPSRPNDIESKPRDCFLVLGPAERRELVRQLTATTPEGS